MTKTNPLKILFVCTGNICRSPTAEAIARSKAKKLGLEEKFIFDSAGIQGFHVGEFPDSRTVATGLKHGISFADIFSRKITKDDFENFDLILAMDRSHYSWLLKTASEKQKKKIKLFLEFCAVKNSWNDEVIDPYYKNDGAFDEVFEVIDSAVENLLK